MDTLRERHFARHGMGYANRPGQHYAIGLDSQPRSICLSTPGRCQSDPNTDRFADSYSNTHCNCDGHSDRNRHCNTSCNGDPHSNTGKTDADTQASANAAASPISADSR